MTEPVFREIEALQYLSADLTPGSVDHENRTVECVWSTGQKVTRFDCWTGEKWFLQLSMDPTHVDLSLANGAAPVLDTHGSYELADVIGVVEKASVDGKRGLATLRFAKTPEVESTWMKVADGIIRCVSPGIEIKKLQDITENEDKIKTYLAVDYIVRELSMCPIGADSGAQTMTPDAKATARSRVEVVNRADAAQREAQMLKGSELDAGVTGAENDPVVPAVTLTIDPDPVAALLPVDAEALKTQAVTAERKRVKTIRESGIALGMKAEFIQEALDVGMGVEQFRDAAIMKKAEEDAKVTIDHRITMGTQDEFDTLREALESQMLHRFNPSVFKLSEPAKQYVGLSLLEIGRECLTARGIKHRGESRYRVAELAFNATSDFPYILASVAGKSLRTAYDLRVGEWKKWTKQQNAADFKEQSRLQLGDAPTLLKVSENGEFKRGTMSEGKETYKLATYGRVLSISRQAIINDDLGAFTRVPELFGIAAANLETDTVYGILTANAALADTVALFHATHANLAGTGTVISDTSLGVALAAMRKQKSLDGQYINVVPKFLLVQPDQEAVAKKYTTTLGPTVVIAGKASDINAFGIPGMVVSGIEVIVEPRLVGTTTAWYLAADPSQVDTVEYAYLEGQEGVYLETRMGFDVDGIEAKCRIDFAAKALDHRGLYKNAGA